MELISNVVNYDRLGDLYIQILEDLSNILEKSYGPYGSNTLIQNQPGVAPFYTKDGHTILGSVKYHNIIEKSIVSNILSITEYIVKHVGDGTTSAVLLSYEILKNLKEYMKEYPEIQPVRLVQSFNKAVEVICECIKNHGREFDIEKKDPYYISMISTNGDDEVSQQIQTLYKELGKELYISLNVASTKDDVVNIYDGLVLETGLIEECYINEPIKKVAKIDNPHIYAFRDPVDTPEMMTYFEKIILENIVNPWNKKDAKGIIPTVILAPVISRDSSGIMNIVMDMMSKMNGPMIKMRPPLLILTQIDSTDMDMYIDISQMCGCPIIQKYIDLKKQKADQEAGTAPTIDTITEFYGTAEGVEADQYKTTFFNPERMFEKNENGELVATDYYDNIVAYLETEIEKAYKNHEDSKTIYHLKKRLNSLKATFVEWFVGGVSQSDRDARKGAIEDAVKNCRSAARDGVGFGANFEGFRASIEASIPSDYPNHNVITDCFGIINKAYNILVRKLYNIKEAPYINATSAPKNLLNPELPVLSSIKSDQMILEGVGKIISIMATSNQYICPEPTDTVPYRAAENIRKREEEISKENTNG